VEVGRNCELL